jgi:hypothetical protein
VGPLGAEVDLAEALAPRNASTRSVCASLLEEAAEHAGLLPEAGIEDEFVGGLVGKLQSSYASAPFGSVGASSRARRRWPIRK